MLSKLIHKGHDVISDIEKLLPIKNILRDDIISENWPTPGLSTLSLVIIMGYLASNWGTFTRHRALLIYLMFNIKHRTKKTTEHATKNDINKQKAMISSVTNFLLSGGRPTDVFLAPSRVFSPHGRLLVFFCDFHGWLMM